MKFTGLLLTIALISEAAAFSSSIRGTGSETPLAKATQQTRNLRQRCKLAYANAIEAQSTEDYLEANVRCSKEDMQRFHQEYKHQLKAALMRR